MKFLNLILLKNNQRIWVSNNYTLSHSQLHAKIYKNILTNNDLKRLRMLHSSGEQDIEPMHFHTELMLFYDLVFKHIQLYILVYILFLFFWIQASCKLKLYKYSKSTVIQN